MKILLIVHWHQCSSFYKYPSMRTGMYALVTDDESVLDFHGRDKRATKFSDPMYRRIDDFFFSEYNAKKWEGPAFLNKKFRQAAQVITECGVPDKIVLVEV